MGRNIEGGMVEDPAEIADTMGRLREGTVDDPDANSESAEKISRSGRFAKADRAAGGFHANQHPNRPSGKHRY